MVRLTKGLDVCWIESKSVIASVRHDVIANGPDRLSNATHRALDHDRLGGPTSHPKVTQTEHAMRMSLQMRRPQLLPLIVVAAR